MAIILAAYKTDRISGVPLGQGKDVSETRSEEFPQLWITCEMCRPLCKLPAIRVLWCSRRIYRNRACRLRSFRKSPLEINGWDMCPREVLKWLIRLA